MNTIRRFCSGSLEVTIGLLLVTCNLNCGSSKPRPPVENAPPPDFSGPPVQTKTMPIAANELDLPVKEGTMPLAYLVESAGGVRVVDMTTHHPLAQATVPARSIVSVDADHGISIAGTLYVPGPLSEEDRYAVYVYSGGFHPEQDMGQTTEHGDPSILHKKQSSGEPHLTPTTGPSPQH